jgi:hypothetical protein
VNVLYSWGYRVIIGAEVMFRDVKVVRVKTVKTIHARLNRSVGHKLAEGLRNLVSMVI